MPEPDTENRTQAASLGCGTLILIALIVLFFSGGDTTSLTNEIAALRQEVEALRAEQQETHRLVERLAERDPLDPGLTPIVALRAVHELIALEVGRDGEAVDGRRENRKALGRRRLGAEVLDQRLAAQIARVRAFRPVTQAVEVGKRHLE